MFYWILFYTHGPTIIISRRYTFKGIELSFRTPVIAKDVKDFFNHSETAPRTVKITLTDYHLIKLLNLLANTCLVTHPQTWSNISVHLESANLWF